MEVCMGQSSNDEILVDTILVQSELGSTMLRTI